MVITDLLENNAKQYPNDVALVEINPDITEKKRTTWKEYGLVETQPDESMLCSSAKIT